LENNMTVPVVYHGGAFVPKSGLNLDEGTEGFVVIDSAVARGALITDPAERGRLLADLVEEMKSSPLPTDSPRLSREQMHERG
jgi:hypothetical protein